MPAVSGVPHCGTGQIGAFGVCRLIAGCTAARHGEAMRATATAADRWPPLLVLLTALLTAAACAPLLAIRTPAMVDYINHLARMELLAAPGAPVAYRIGWHLMPNLAMDIMVPWLARVMPVEAAARLFFGVTQLLLVSGAVALEFSVKRRIGLAGLVALAVLFSLPFAWGLVNFSFGLGIAQWGLAAWTVFTARPLWQRALLHAAVVAALFAAHFFALGIYGLVVGLIELPPLLHPRLQLRRAGELVAVLAAPVLLLLAAMAATGSGIGEDVLEWDFGLKLIWLLRFFNVYDLRVSVGLAAAVALLIVWASARRGLRPTSVGLRIAAGLALLYLLLPRRLFGVAYVDVRVIAAAALILPAFVHMQRSRAVAAALVLIAVVNAGVSVAAWAALARDYDEFRASFVALAPGTAVLTAVAAESGAADAPLYYAPTLAAPARGVFVASLYAAGGMQPLAPAPAFAQLAVAQAIDYLPVPLASLGAGGHPLRHATHWRRDYRYLHVIGSLGATPLPGLTELVRGRRFVLYEVKRGPA